MMHRILLLLLILISSACGSAIQVKVRDGETAYNAKQYSSAVKLLRSDYTKAKTRLERGKIAFMLGESYKALQQGADAADWYQRAYDNSYGGVNPLREWAYMLKMTEQYDEAIAAFKELGSEIGSPYEYRKDIQACELAQTWLKETRREYEVELAGFNSGKADYAPALYGDNALVFTSDRAGGTGDEIYLWTGNSFSDLYQVDLSSEEVSQFSKKLNTTDNEGTAYFSPDQKSVFFTRCDGPKKTDKYCKIYRSDWDGNGWSVPALLEFTKENVNYMHPALAPDGKSLYFSTNDPEGFGGYDIFVVEQDRNGNWGEPRPLSAAVNTAGNEQFPVWHKEQMYFSSDRHTSMGGLDIFRTYKLNNGAWAPAYNLKAPINSPADDFGLIIVANTNLEEGELEKGYFTSSRLEGMGGDDIYTYVKKELPPLPDPPEVVEKPEMKLLLEIYVVEKIFENPTNPNSTVLGRKPIPAADLAIDFGEANEKVQTNDEGKYLLELEPGLVYDFIASKPEYLRNIADFSAEGLDYDPDNPIQTFELEIELEKIFFNTEIVLENIYYDFDKAYIREDAQPTLNELAALLDLNPEITIELSSHTDCRGPDPFNMNLSQRRAQAAVDYLVSKGITRDRLVAKGYGETVMAVECICSRCTEEEHQRNRRTAFKVLE